MLPKAREGIEVLLSRYSATLGGLAALLSWPARARVTSTPARPYVAATLRVLVGQAPYAVVSWPRETIADALTQTGHCLSFLSLTELIISNRQHRQARFSECLGVAQQAGCWKAVPVLPGMRRQRAACLC